jgi:Flp pilus assembly protein TadD
LIYEYILNSGLPQRAAHTWSAWSSKGYALGRLERYEEAITWYDKANELDSQDFFTLSSKGIALDRLERDEEAIT